MLGARHQVDRPQILVSDVALQHHECLLTRQETNVPGPAAEGETGQGIRSAVSALRAHLECGADVGSREHDEAAISRPHGIERLLATYRHRTTAVERHTEEMRDSAGQDGG